MQLARLACFKQNFLTEQLLQQDSISYLNHLLMLSIKLGISDLHFEPSLDEYRLRYRLHGKLYLLLSIAKELTMTLIVRLKILSNLDIAEQRLAQDGSFFFIWRLPYSIRLSFCPMVFGEKVVLRFLLSEQDIPDYSQLFNVKQLSLIQQGFAELQGLIIISGSTGSGKTMTLYSLALALRQYNVLSMEEPVEIYLSCINQLSLKSTLGLTYTSVLKSFLRQDPDVILIGEIREKAAMQTAIRAAGTGHLVIATIHAGSIKQTLFRMHALGIDRASVLRDVKLLVQQRLVTEPGCRRRKAVFEVIKVTPELYKNY